MVYNKKGAMPTMMLIFFIFFAFAVILISGILFFTLEKVDDAFESITGLQIGESNFSQVYDETLDQGITSSINTVNYASLGILFGMIIVILVMGYSLQDRGRLLIIVDVFLIIGSFIAAVYISQTFNTFMQSSEDFLDIYSNELSLPARMVLNLPIIVPIVGILVMILTYGIIKKREPNILTAPDV